MRIEYFADGSDDCPLILMHGEDPTTALTLSEAFRKLSRLEVSRLAIHDLPGFTSVKYCLLFASVAESDTGVRMIQSPNVFECFLRSGTWENIVGLLEPFCEPDKDSGTRFQYLEASGDIRLLISNERAW